MSWMICLNTSTIKPTPLIRKIELAAKHGFDGIELWINDIYEYIGQGGEVRDVEKALADAGLIVPCMIALRGWAEPGPEEYPLALDEAKRRMELARRLGSPFIVATPPRYPCELRQVSQRYRDLLRIGKQVGVRPAMEYIGFFQSVSRLSQAWQIVQEAADPDAALVLDAFHTWRGGEGLEQLESVPAARIAHYHFDDAPGDKPRERQTDPDRVMQGDGVIDLTAEVKLLERKGYRETVSLELFNRHLWACDPNEVLAIGIERMRRYFQQ